MPLAVAAHNELPWQPLESAQQNRLSPDDFSSASTDFPARVPRRTPRL